MYDLRRPCHHRIHISIVSRCVWWSNRHSHLIHVSPYPFNSIAQLFSFLLLLTMLSVCVPGQTLDMNTHKISSTFRRVQRNSNIEYYHWFRYKCYFHQPSQLILSVELISRSLPNFTPYDVRVKCVSASICLPTPQTHHRNEHWVFNEYALSFSISTEQTRPGQIRVGLQSQRRWTRRWHRSCRRREQRVVYIAADTSQRPNQPAFN